MPERKRIKLALATTAAATAPYTCPAEKYAIIENIHVANVDGTNSVDVDVWITDAGDGDAQVYLCKSAPLAAGDAMEIAGPITLLAGDTINGLASAASDAVMLVSLYEEPEVKV